MSKPSKAIKRTLKLMVKGNKTVDQLLIAEYRAYGIITMRANMYQRLNRMIKNELVVKDGPHRYVLACSDEYGYKIVADQSFKALQDAGRCIIELEHQLRWRSVEDELPEDWVDVLVLFSGGDCFYDIANYDSSEGNWAFPSKGFVSSEDDPTHWMPLPDSPVST